MHPDLSQFNSPSVLHNQEFLLYWNSLSTDSKISILELFTKEDYRKYLYNWPSHFFKEFLELVSSEENPYLKHLATKLSDEKVISYSFTSNEIGSEFWSLDHEIRLAIVKEFKNRIVSDKYLTKSEILLKIVGHVQKIASDDNDIWYEELEDILNEYAVNFFSATYYQNKFLLDHLDDDLFMTHGLLGKELQNHWEVISLIPSYIGEYYINTVPFTDQLFISIDQKILNKIHPLHLNHIFTRKDVTLYNERYDYLFKEKTPKLFAATYNIRFGFEDLSLFFSEELLHKLFVADDQGGLNNTEINSFLKYLRFIAHAKELKIVFYQIGIDLFEKLYVDENREICDKLFDKLQKKNFKSVEYLECYFSNLYDVIDTIEKNQRNRMSSLSAEQQFIHLIDLRAFILAKLLSRNNNYELTGSLQSVKKLLCPDNFYKTYKNIVHFFYNECNANFDKRTITGHLLYHDLAEETYISDDNQKFEVRLNQYQVEMIKNTQEIQNIVNSFKKIGIAIYNLRYPFYIISGVLLWKCFG